MVENCMAGYNSCMFAYGQVSRTSGVYLIILSFRTTGAQLHSVHVLEAGLHKCIC